MPTTTNRGYSVPSTGTQDGIWGSDDLNPNFNLIDKNLGGVASVALSNSNVSLSAAEYACGTIRFSGVLTANVTVTFPAVAGWWTIINKCTGNFYIRLSCSSGGLKICPPPGDAIDIGLDGTDAFYRNLPHAIGSFWDYGGTSIPPWVLGCSVPPYLYCNGGTFSSVTYPYLFAALGTTTLPDTRGRGRASINDGTGRIASTYTGLDGNTNFAGGGSDAVGLADVHNGPHYHIGTTENGGVDHTHQYDRAKTSNSPKIAGSGTEAYVAQEGATTGGASSYLHTHFFVTQYSGNGTPHNNMPPTYIGGITMIRAG